MPTRRRGSPFDRPRWTEQDAREVLDELGRSGESVAAFAAAHDLDPQRLYAWRHRLGDAEPTRFQELIVHRSALRRRPTRRRSRSRSRLARSFACRSRSTRWRSLVFSTSCPGRARAEFTAERAAVRGVVAPRGMAAREKVTSAFAPDLDELRAWLLERIAALRFVELVTAVLALIGRMRDLNTELVTQLAELRRQRPRAEGLRRLERQLVLPIAGLTVPSAPTRHDDTPSNGKGKSRKGRHPGRGAPPAHLPRVPVFNPRAAGDARVPAVRDDDDHRQPLELPRAQRDPGACSSKSGSTRPSRAQRRHDPCPRLRRRRSSNAASSPTR